MNRMNMRTIVIIAVLVIISAISGVSSANDGRFYEEGGLIIPVKEEKISIEKEILTLTFLEDVEKWRVDVYFEFYNPGEALELEVGFVGAIENDFENTPKTPAQGGFENFTVLVNEVPVSLNGATMVFKTPNAEQDDNVRRLMIPFKMPLKHGLNIVKHSYLHCGYLQMEGVYFGQYGMTYIITTGKNWAGGVIKDFTIDLAAREDTFYFLNDFPGQKNDGSDSVWTNPQNCILLRKGCNFSRNIKNYAPATEITVAALRDKWLALGTVVKDQAVAERLLSEYKDIRSASQEIMPFNCFLYYAMTGSEADLQKLGLASLALLRNAIYAYYGYPFTNRQYREFFANHYFYERDEQFSEAKIPEKMKRRIEIIKALENKK